MREKKASGFGLKYDREPDLQQTMVLTVDGNSLNVANNKNTRFVPALETNQKPYTSQVTEIAPYVRTYL